MHGRVTYSCGGGVAKAGTKADARLARLGSTRSKISFADGLEVVFSSNRSGTLGAQDIWVATRASLSSPWSAPANLGSAVNTSAAETRPSLSNDGNQLLFGRSPGPEGMSDIYFTSR